MMASEYSKALVEPVHSREYLKIVKDMGYDLYILKVVIFLCSCQNKGLNLRLDVTVAVSHDIITHCSVFLTLLVSSFMTVVLQFTNF